MSTPRADDLRSLVRQLIQEAVPELRQPVVRPVRIRSDEDLNRFALELVRLLGDPETAPALKSGRMLFRLDPQEHGAAPVSVRRDDAGLTRTGGTDVAPCAVLEVQKGAVTEKVVARAAAEGALLVLGPHAVLTPLAREMIRKSNLRMERRSC